MPRIQSLDLARGFTIFCMPAVHTVMLYSNPEVNQSFLGIILRFIAEGPGAQLFMLLMGVNFALKSSNSPSEVGRRREVLKRWLYLFIAAYLLNFFKFILPLTFGLLPGNLLRELHLANDLSSAPFFFLIGDILHFAAIANLILYTVTRFRYYPFIAAVLAITILFTSPYLWDHSTGIESIDHFIGLFNGHPPMTFFPVFPWLVYPLLGLPLGYAIKKYDADFILRRSALLGAVIIIVSLGLPSTPPQTEYLSFYRSEPADTLFHIGIVLVWLQLWHWLSSKSSLKGGFRWALNPAFTLLSWCSRHITVIYIIQWILICWCMAIAGYGTLGFISSIAWMINITVFTLLLTWLITKQKPYSSPK